MVKLDGAGQKHAAVLGAAPIILNYYLQGLRSCEAWHPAGKQRPAHPHPYAAAPVPVPTHSELKRVANKRRGGERGRGRGFGAVGVFRVQGRRSRSVDVGEFDCLLWDDELPWPAVYGRAAHHSLPLFWRNTVGEESGAGDDQRTSRSTEAVIFIGFQKETKQGENTKLLFFFFFFFSIFISGAKMEEQTMLCFVLFDKPFTQFECVYLTGEPHVKCTGNLGICFFILKRLGYYQCCHTIQIFNQIKSYSFCKVLVSFWKMNKQMVHRRGPKNT